MIRRWLAGLVFLNCVVALWSRPPEWVKSRLKEDVSWAGTSHPAVSLLNSQDVRYLSADRVRRIFRGAIRVTDVRGRDAAVCRYLFNPTTEKIVSARAWIVAPDGRRSDDFSTGHFSDAPLPIGRAFWIQLRVISFSAAERITVGGVLAWEFQVESQSGISDVNWNFATEIPSSLEALEITPTPGGKIEWHESGPRRAEPQTGSAPGSLRWEMRRGLPPNGDRPTGFVPTPWSISARGRTADLAPQIQTWADMARIAAEVIEPRIELDPAVQAKADALIAGKSGRTERIRALTEFVQREITYLAVTLDRDYLAGYRPHPAAEVLRNRYGDCKDKAALLAALLRAVGDNGHVVLVFAGNAKAVNAEWPSAAFNHAIVGIHADMTTPADWPVVDAGEMGRLILFDPTDASTPLGMLPISDQGGHGLVASNRSTALVRLPMAEPASNRQVCRIEAAIDGEGTLTAKIDEVVRGTNGVAWHALREKLTREVFAQRLEQRLQQATPHWEKLTWTDAWNASDAEWRLDVAFKAPRYARVTAGRLMLISPHLMRTTERLSAWTTNEGGIAVMAGRRTEQSVRLVLPEHATVVELPEDVALTSPAATARITYRKDGEAIVYRHELEQRPGFLDKANYDELRALVQKVEEAERRPILIRAATAPPAISAR